MTFGTQQAFLSQHAHETYHRSGMLGGIPFVGATTKRAAQACNAVDALAEMERRALRAEAALGGADGGRTAAEQRASEL